MLNSLLVKPSLTKKFVLKLDNNIKSYRLLSIKLSSIVNYELMLDRNIKLLLINLVIIDYSFYKSEQLIMTHTLED